MRTSLEARLERLERHAADQGTCTDPRCQHMQFTRCLRRANGLPEYPLPLHTKEPPELPRGWFVDLLASLNRRNAGASPCE